MTKANSIELMPVPFAWINIPAGKVILTPSGYKKNSYLQQETLFTVSAFEICKYPITNAQYAEFVKAGGYHERKWWTDLGWKACQEGWHYDKNTNNGKAVGPAWTEPAYGQEEPWNRAEYPIIGVSWYEAIAFCLWLNDVTGENIMLPTEQQWQRAAQGDKELAYPWGNKWDGKRCNNSVALGFNNVNMLKTPVRQFEGQGNSPYGVVDLVGNMWEWCVTGNDDGSQSINSNNEGRVLRGGSAAGDFAEMFRCDFRMVYYPQARFEGFRLARSP